MNADGVIALGGDETTRFDYDTTDGHLYFDANGAAADGSRLIAVLSEAPALTMSDVQMMA